MEWTKHPVRGHFTTANRHALIYEVKSHTNMYRVMLGLKERGRCELLEHLIHDEAATWFYPYRQPLYM